MEIEQKQKFAPCSNFFKKSLINSHILAENSCLISNIQKHIETIDNLYKIVYEAIR